MENRLLIVGASARAAAQSAARAGLTVSAIDLFGDQDLREVADVAICPAACYPAAIPQLAEQLAGSPCCYVGAMENYPTVLTRLQQSRTLFGISPKRLAACRDPFLLAAVAGQHGLEMPRTVHRLDRSEQLDAWLQKSYASGGGTGVTPARSRVAPPGCYFQQRVGGPVHSGSYLVAGGQCHLLGVARQFTAADFTAAELDSTGEGRFRFAGAAGPIPLAPPDRALWTQLGACLARQFHLQGLFGVDTIWDPRSGRAPCLLEINPRYTSSMELFDRAYESIDPHLPSLLGLHVQAFQGGCVTPPVCEPPLRFAKIIVYAEEVVTIDSDFLAAQQTLAGPEGWLADIPAVGMQVQRRAPICTRILRATSLEQLDRHIGPMLDYQTKIACIP